MLRNSVIILIVACVFGIMVAKAVAQTPNNNVTLTWDASQPAASVAGYEIRRGVTTGVYTVTTDVGNVLTTAISNLPFGTHFFVARAYAAGKTQFSGNSNEVSKEFVLTLTPPFNFRITSP